MISTIFVAGLLLACGDKEGDEAPDLINTTDDESACGGNAPVIHAVTCENSGMQEYEENVVYPTFSLTANATDEDGDMTYYQMLVDFDDNIDGVEDDEDEQLNPIEGAINGDECETPPEGASVDINVTIYLQGAQPKKDTRYEWFVRVVDSVGKTSEPFMVTCTTPDEAGEGDPDQE